MIVLGIDPGTATTGYGLIKIKQGFLKKRGGMVCLDYGLIQTSPSSPTPERLKKINNELNKIMKKYQPNIMAVENLYFFKNFKTVISVAQAGGVILLTAAKNKIPVEGFTPLQVKAIITKNGWAPKSEVQEKVKKILRLKTLPKSDDIADALGIAICGALRCFSSKKNK